MSKGFTCPRCHSDRIGVAETRRLDNAILRRRRCFTCACNFKTFEIIADMIPTEPEFDFLFQKAT